MHEEKCEYKIINALYRDARCANGERMRCDWRIRSAPGYYAQYTALGNLMGLQANGHTMLLAGMGLHGYEPRVNTPFGFPRGIRPGGVIFDIPIAGVQLTDGLEQEKTAQFNQQIGLLSSALEHATPEQMFSTEQQPADAISAVKALSKANAQGQRIYQMTRDNIAETLPNLNLARETENEIRTALNAGLAVIAHTDNVSVPGWTGAGYIIFNPETGSGAYKISGGANGGFLAFLAEGLLKGRIKGLHILANLVLFGAVIAVGAIVTLIVSFVIGPLLIAGLVLIISFLSFMNAISIANDIASLVQAFMNCEGLNLLVVLTLLLTITLLLASFIALLSGIVAVIGNLISIILGNIAAKELQTEFC